LRLNYLLSRQSSLRSLQWGVKGCAFACFVGLALSGIGFSHARKHEAASKAKVASQEAFISKTKKELSQKPRGLSRSMPRDSSLGRDQYVASFIEELGILAQEAGCTVVSVKAASGTTTQAGPPTPQAPAPSAQSTGESGQPETPSSPAQPPQSLNSPEPGGGQSQGGTKWEETQLEALLTGDYFSTLRLLDALCRSGKVCSVNGFELSRSGVSQESGRVAVQLKLLISIFRRSS
jgi:hypothetical protein